MIVMRMIIIRLKVYFHCGIEIVIDFLKLSMKNFLFRFFSFLFFHIFSMRVLYFPLVIDNDFHLLKILA